MAVDMIAEAVTNQWFWKQFRRLPAETELFVPALAEEQKQEETAGRNPIEHQTHCRREFVNNHPACQSHAAWLVRLFQTRRSPGQA